MSIDLVLLNDLTYIPWSNGTQFHTSSLPPHRNNQRRAQYVRMDYNWIHRSDFLGKHVDTYGI
jgi:hypothetical protein